MILKLDISPNRGCPKLFRPNPSGFLCPSSWYVRSYCCQHPATQATQSRRRPVLRVMKFHTGKDREQFLQDLGFPKFTCCDSMLDSFHEISLPDSIMDSFHDMHLNLPEIF